MTPSFGVKLLDFNIDILYNHTICRNSPFGNSDKRWPKIDLSLPNFHTQNASLYHAIHLSVMSQFSYDVMLTSNLLHGACIYYSKMMESGNVITQMKETNGSFQNQPLPSRCTRKRGISALLQDITNSCEQPMPRRSAVQVKKTMEIHSCTSAPHGNSAQGGKLRHTSMSRCTGAVHESFNLLQKINDNASEYLTSYTQRKVCFEVQKALAINVMAIAISHEIVV